MKFSTAHRFPCFFVFFVFVLGFSPLGFGQSYGTIPIKGAKVLQTIQKINAPSGFRIFGPDGRLVKRVDEAGEVSVKAYVEHGGTLFLMSDWSFDRLQNNQIPPNWMVVDGVTVGNGADGEEQAAADDEPEPSSEFYQIFFPDSNDAQAPLLSYVENSQLIYADDEWVILGKFVRDQSAEGYHFLNVYRANTLRLEFQLKILNYVFCMDWSPERKQFLAVTTAHLGNEMLVKWPEDEPSLLLIDPVKKRIESINYDIPSTDRVRWSGGGLLIEYNGDAPTPGDRSRFSNRPFRDVSIRQEKLRGFIPELPERRAGYIEEAALDLVGLTNFSKEHHTWYVNIGMDIGAGEGGASRIVRTTDFGHMIDLDLGELRSKRLGNGNSKIEKLAIFGNGMVGVLEDTSQVRFFGQGPAASVDLAPFWNAESSFDFTDEAGFLVGPGELGSARLEVRKIQSDGDIADIPFNVRLSDQPRWASYPARQSIAVHDYDESANGMTWREFAWSSGKQVGETFHDGTGKGMGPGGRKFGQGEGNWGIVATLIDAHTGGYDYKVDAIHEASGKTVTFNDGEMNGDDPLYLFHLDSEGFNILCAGNHKVYLYRHDLRNGRSQLVQEWDKNPGHGEAGFDRRSSRVFIPRENGYEAFTVAKREVIKAFDLYFHGSSEYAVMLPNGFYAGSPGCESFLSIETGKGNGSLAATVLAPWRNRPAKVLAILGGTPADVTALEKVTERWLDRSGYAGSGEPSLSDLNVIRLGDGVPLKVSDSNFEIPFKLEIGSAPPEEITVKINGVVVETLTGLDGLEKGDKREGKAGVTLSSGHNWIELNSKDANGRRSEPVRFRMVNTQTKKKNRRFVVAMGVSEYANPKLNLALAARDAQDAVTTFSGLSGVSETETLLLTDSEAVAGAIGKIRTFLSDTTADDEVIFFGAAHGVLDENLEYVFCTHEFDAARASETGLKLEEIIEAIRSGESRKCLILLDTCQAGAVGEKDVQLLAANKGQPVLDVQAISRSAITTINTGLSVSETSRYIEDLFLLPGSLEGIHIIGASSASGFALELDGILNGVFTSALIEALRMGHADGNSDGLVSIEELKSFLDARVTELTGGAQQPSIVASEKDQPMSFPVSTR